MICENLSVLDNGHLAFAGLDTVALAEQYGTPLYLMDEARIRERCRTYLSAVDEAFDGNAKVLYASKAASFKRIYEIMREEGMCTDVVSSGEIFTAKKAGFDLQNAYFHSNNKTDADIVYAMDVGVGYFVVDNEEELAVIADEAAKRGIRQKILLRLTPGIDPHTYEAINTGKVDSKFGSAIETGQAEIISSAAMEFSSIRLCGFHCHVGSQVFDSDVYIRAADVMLEFAAMMQERYGLITEELDLGGGYGVRYTEDDPVIDIRANILSVGAHMKEKAASLGIALPCVCFEPGRSIVADAGMTLYTVGTVKRIPGYKNYVSVDGSMADNIRHALYGAPYTVLAADNMTASPDMTCTVAGRCCESGDLIAEGVSLPSSTKRGNILACLTTGAYHYSMASNYNRLGKPPVVMIADGKSYVAVKRETFEDVSALDV